MQRRTVQPYRRIPNRTLAELRINAGLSPNDLAYQAQVSANSIRLAERGYIPGPRIQFALASTLGVRPTDIWPIATQVAA
jgi:lambda repressor-like predicted transcriptional regulator